jgi:predicted TPR repeat methyltransferase
MQEVIGVAKTPPRRSSPRVRLPTGAAALEQDEEWCEIENNGTWQRIRFHDYAAIFGHKGLYEHLFYGLLQCCSPERVASMLETVVRESGSDPASHRILDLGAGNGMLGESLLRRGFGSVMGIDLLPEAKSATERDRPRQYGDYVVADLASFEPETRERIERFAPTCLASVAALGFGDVPPTAYFNALTVVPIGGLLAFNIRTDFLDARYAFGFSELVRRMMTGDVIRIESMQRYRHRISVSGQPLWYTAVVATKLADVPAEMLVES